MPGGDGTDKVLQGANNHSRDGVAKEGP